MILFPSFLCLCALQNLWPSVYLRWATGSSPDKIRWRAVADLKRREDELKAKAVRLRRQLQELERGASFPSEEE
jgi:hypothetical protein